MFLILLTYIRPLEDVEKALPGHIAYLDKHYASGEFICSGRRIPRTGGVILCRAGSREETEKIVAEDPFCIQGIARYEIVEFVPTRYAENFETFVDPQ